jgi:hypothetical protein
MRSRRTRILEDALLLLGEGVVEALSIRKLAEAADVASRTIYSLAGQKEDVWTCNGRLIASPSRGIFHIFPHSTFGDRSDGYSGLRFLV